ncbi:MAG TPA: (2Fe-2S) ferredoxin domain-containing protein [Thermoanaerobaculia bacterium]|nr:(2Fe-2S) ferredoxin domain-containing protein [Thermoanaerobaculia bacterium]
MRFPYQRHFLVCTGPRCSDERRGKEDCGEEIRARLKELNKALGRKPLVRVCGVSCLDLCELGPNMVVWPEGEVHSGLDREAAVSIYHRVMGDVGGDAMTDDGIEIGDDGAAGEETEE